MNRFVLTLLLLVPIACGTSLAGERASPTDEAKLVQHDVDAIIRAIYRGDLDTVLEFTHPAIIQTLGGKSAARAAMAQTAQQIDRLEMKVESLSFPAQPDFLEGGGRRFVIVPTFMILATKTQRLESRNFQFGVLEPGSPRWTYIEGSRLTKDNVQKLFPGFPPNYEFPPCSRNVLGPKRAA